MMLGLEMASIVIQDHKKYGYDVAAAAVNAATTANTLYAAIDRNCNCYMTSNLANKRKRQWRKTEKDKLNQRNCRNVPSKHGNELEHQQQQRNAQLTIYPKLLNHVGSNIPRATLTSNGKSKPATCQQFSDSASASNNAVAATIIPTCCSDIAAYGSTLFLGNDTLTHPRISSVCNITPAATYQHRISCHANVTCNLLHRFFTCLLWHITASTAVAVLATLCYFIAYTQGAAVLPGKLIVGPAVSTTLPTTFVIRATAPTSSLAIATNLTNTTGKLQRIGNNRLHRNASNISWSSSIETTEIALLTDISLAFSTRPTFGGESQLTTLTSKHLSFPALNVNSTRFASNRSEGDNRSDVAMVDDAFDDISAEDASEYIFDRTDVRIIFITLYTMVFCCCFFGNLLVILVVTLSRRLRSITNFFLANLALADFCVGLFCVMQNLSIYLIDSWVFGEFLCRMYQFVHSLSYTASIFILVVICMERYFAIVHPITCKQILTAARLRMVILTVWITSAVYSTPKFVFSKTIKNVHTESGQEEEICVLDRKMFNSKLLDMINFGLLYVIPLLVMTVLYSKIAIALWRSSRGLSHHLAQQQDNSMGLHNSMYHHHHSHQPLHNNHQQHHHNNPAIQQQSSSMSQQHHQALGTPMSLNSSVGSAGSSTLSRKQSSKYEKRTAVGGAVAGGAINLAESQHDNFQVSLDADRPVVSTCRKTSFYQHNNHLGHPQQPHPRTHLHHNHSGSHHGLHHGSQRVSHISHSSNNVLRARRGVVRMLIIFVLTFALCNLPYHARKMWQYWSRSYRGDSNFNALLTPLTFLVTYFNSGINPLLYAFLSRNFRKGMRELLMCSWRKSKTKSSTNSSMHHKRMTLQTHSLPTDTTHIGNEQL